jgi:KUP system potassium uptake protein
MASSPSADVLPADLTPDPSASLPIHPHDDSPTGKRLAILSLTALGVVYGDIGTSPLYALKECFHGAHGLPLTPANIQGVLSLIVWSLILVVSVKYLIFIMRADNRGEGGILALLALVLPSRRVGTSIRQITPLVAMGLLGAALLYADGVITPAVSVLSAIEGVSIASPALERIVLPLALVIIVGLFAVQRYGTDKVGRLFGPVMFIWFSSIAVMGVVSILKRPQVLASLNPWLGLQFMVTNGWAGLAILGTVVLSVTGAEALYADMGHFGKRPIRLAWFVMVFPALVINYFGQGALLLSQPEAIENPFYLLAPREMLYPLVALAAMAAVVASQALISGAFSLAQQSISLGYIPRFEIRHTSKVEAGQIYVPEINIALGVGTVLFVLAFQSSTRLASLYGIATVMTMAITTVLFHQVALRRWEWPAWQAWTLSGFFMLIDVAFLVANVPKILAGGWITLAIAMALVVLMATWKRGRFLVQEILGRSTLPIDLFLDDIEARKPHRVSGTAVFMTSSSEGVPPVLLHHLKHNKVLHETVMLLSIITADVPEIPPSERVKVEDLGQGFFRVRGFYGFMQTQDVRDILDHVRGRGVLCKAHDTSFYLGRELLLPSGSSPLSWWRKRLFILMARNARSATAFFNIPSNRVVELGTQIEF